MATPWTKWLKSILVVITCVAAEAPPHPPSQPVCNIPCNDHDCTVNIHCTWDQGSDNNITSNYTLYWKSANSRVKHLSVIGSSGIIPREHAPRHEKLHVWVGVANQYGHANSEQLVFNAEDIFKPVPPKFSGGIQEPLEIYWAPVCGQLGFSIGLCDVQHKTEEDKAWVELEGGFYGSYTLVDPIPGTMYEFQVRCSCNNMGLMSDWSASFQIRSAELAPVGKVDVWRDCGVFPTTADCYLTWKNLTTSQARGVILGYEVRISYNNGTSALINVSAIVPNNQFVFDGKIWHLSSPLTHVSSVSVSAYNSLGATLPSYLTLPLKGKEQNDDTIHLIMNEDNLTVSWDVSAQLSHNLKEYVVQYKEAGCPGGFGFDWIKANKTNKAGFIGQFKKYTPYQVSLYLMPHIGEVRHLASVIKFSDEKAPPIVPSFKVSSMEENAVSLVWKSIPLTSQGGLVLYYQIGIGTKVHNVSASLHHENKPFKMHGLYPGKDYKVWIRAVNSAGPGPKVITSVKTKHRNDYALSIGPVGGILALFFGICLVVVFRRKKMSALLPGIFTDKVPDPWNSHIFIKMSQQMNEPFTLPYIPITGQDPKISLIEIVTKKSQEFQLDGLTGPGELNVEGCSQVGCQNTEENISVKEGHDRPGCRYGKGAYSKAMDSDEDCHSSDEEQFTSGYEQHFMPTEMDILDV